MASAELVELKRAIARVGRHFVAPSVRVAAGPFSDLVYDRVRALRILACAEFERYFENRALKVADRASKYQLQGRCNEIVNSALAAAYLSGFVIGGSNEAPRARIARSFYEKSHAEFIVSAVSAYGDVVKDNHGVRDENLYVLLRPIAFDFKAFDPLFLPEITQFAKQRGEIAHKGVRVTMKLSPVDEIARIARLVGFVEQIDGVFERPHP